MFLNWEKPEKVCFYLFVYYLDHLYYNEKMGMIINKLHFPRVQTLEKSKFKPCDSNSGLVLQEHMLGYLDQRLEKVSLPWCITMLYD